MTQSLMPIHPGAFVKELIEGYDINVRVLAKALCVHPIRIVQIVQGKRAITPDTAIRLAICFGGEAKSLMSLKIVKLKIAYIPDSKRTSYVITKQHLYLSDDVPLETA